MPGGPAEASAIGSTSLLSNEVSWLIEVRGHTESDYFMSARCDVNEF